MTAFSSCLGGSGNRDLRFPGNLSGTVAEAAGNVAGRRHLIGSGNRGEPSPSTTGTVSPSLDGNRSRCHAGTRPGR